jgi:hypothetical protein
MEKIDISKIKLYYSDIPGTGKEIFAEVGQEVPCVEFTMRGDVPQPITSRCLPPEFRARLYSERWVQFEPKAWTEMVGAVYKEMVRLWNKKYSMEVAVADSAYYIVKALRYGNWDSYSYIVGVCSTLEKAKKLAQEEFEFRGGKYTCQVFDFEVDGKETEQEKQPLYEAK